MANALYDKGREGFLAGDIAWDSDDIRAALVDTGTYTVDLATHEDRADISGEVANLGSAFAGKTVTAGVADANDITFSSVSGNTVEAIIIYKHTGVAANDRLIGYIDTAASGLPVTPNGGDITVSWSDGSNKIFKL